MNLRPAVLSDMPAMLEIYNDEVLHGVATFDTEIKTLAEREAWFHRLHPDYPIIIGEENGEFLGWSSVGPWSDRKGYAGTCENSVYLKKSAQGKGHGKTLLAALIVEAKKAGFHTLIARITDGNETSIKLHKRYGFEHAGVLKEAGFKFGRFLDVTHMQKIL